MNEEASGTQVASEVVSQVETGDSSDEQVAQTETSFIDKEGNFLSGCKEHYLPEELRTDKVFDTFSDVSGGLKMFGSLQGMIGKKGVIVPGEASPQHEWDNFHREMGRPDTKDQYKMDIAEDLSEVYDENLVASARDMFHELGLDQKKVDRLWEFEELRIRNAIKVIGEDKAKAKLDMENFYKEEYKDDWPIMQQRANRLISENTDNSEEQKALVEIIGNNPIVGKFFGTISAKFQEHKIITDPEQTSGMSPSEALTEAKKIESTPGFILPDDKGNLLKDVNITEYNRLKKERDKFYQIANTKPG